MSNATVGVAEIKLADQDPLVGESQTEGHHKVDNPQQAKSVYHCGILKDVCPVVDGHVFLGDPF